LPDTEFQAVGAPVKIADQAAIVVEGRMLTAFWYGVGVLVQPLSLFLAEHLSHRGSLARLNRFPQLIVTGPVKGEYQDVRTRLGRPKMMFDLSFAAIEQEFGRTARSQGKQCNACRDQRAANED